MIRRIYIIIAAILISQTVFAQQNSSASKILKDAKKQYDALRYTSAIPLLLTELQISPGDKAAEEMLANSYRNIKDYNNAVQWYAELTKSGTIKPEWALYYAEALANKEQYQNSEIWYNKYLLLTANKDKRAAAFSKFNPLQSNLFKNRSDWKVEYLNINTAKSEYSPMYYQNGLVFSSNRKIEGLSKRVFEWDETPFTDLYFVDNLSKIYGVNIDSTKAVVYQEIALSGKKLYQRNDDDTKPTSNDSKVVGVYNLKTTSDTLGDYLAAQVKAKPLPGNINSRYHEGPAAVLSNGDIMFTRNNFNIGVYSESRDGINKLNMYTAKAPDFTEIVPFAYNNNQYSVGHPTLNSTGTLLIFVSDMPGGFGGTDLYYCTRPGFGSDWSRPVNMGPTINTEGNEMFPGIHQDSILFFSSTGHPGLGGLDIFQVGIDGAKPLYTPINLGAPFNSSVDDFGLIMSNDEKSGYFSSNRKGNDDIYSFKFLTHRIKLKGIVIDPQNDRLLDNNIVTIEPEGASILQTDKLGRFERFLRVGVDYTFTAKRNGYVGTGIAKISTKGITRDTTLTVILKVNKTVPLEPPPPIPVAVRQNTTCDSVREIVSVKKIYYDLDKSNIRTTAYPELDHIVAILNNHPQLKILITSHCDTRASIQYNLALSLRRSQAARVYLLNKGISSSRIQVENNGKDRLANACPDGVNCSEADQQLNRRTEFVFLNNGLELQDVTCPIVQGALK
jgi:outer membrane protein OmpA-like peptidoglycan-associated protein